jgi:hypothetical protein
LIVGAWYADPSGKLSVGLLASAMALKLIALLLALPNTT